MTIILDGTTGITSPAESVSGNLAFTGTGNRITGDFSNATLANRLMFQTATAGAGTSVTAIPNATGDNSAYNIFSSPDVANSSFGQFRVGAGTGDVRITSGITGTGTYLPMTFNTGGSERVRVDTSGNVGVGTSSPVDLLTVNRASGSGVTSGISLTTAAGAVGDGSYIKWTGAGAGEKVARIDGVQEGSDTGSIRFNTGNGADGFTERMRIDSNGKVAALGSDGAGFTGITSVNSNSSVGIAGVQFGSDPTYVKAAIGLVRGFANGVGSLVFYNDSNTDAANWSTSDEKMRIDSSGNLLVGTTSAVGKLTVAGTVGISVNPGTYTFDTSATGTSIANGGTVNYSSCSGILIVNNWNQGSVGMWMVGGGNTSLVSSVGGLLGAVAYNAGINGYTWTNNTGGSSVFDFVFIRTRTGA